MSAEDQPAASDAPSETESHDEATEQTSDSNFAAALTQLAAESGHEIGDVAVPEVKAEAETETEEADIPGVEEKEPDTEPETEAKEETEKPPEDKEDEKPKGDKLVPLSEVLEERAKKKRANERAERAEQLAEQLQSQLAQNVGPRPTEADPLIDVQDTIALDRLERSYDNVLEMADTSPDALVEQAVEAEKKNSGRDLLERFTPEQILAMTKRKAEKAIRKQIPERRTYLQQRAAADQKAAELYPELIDNDEFRQAAGFLANSLLSGQAMKAPDALIWIARAVKGLQMEQQRNGHDSTKVKSPEAKKIVEASRQKIAPTPTRSRSLPERRGTANLEKASQKFEETGSPEDAENVVAAMFSQRGGSKRVESLAE
jgi:hypothetical protein